MNHQPLKICLPILSFMMVISTLGQNADQTVLASSGNDITVGSISVSSTIGQVVNFPSSSNSIFLTEGFHQTNPIMILTSLPEVEQKISVFPNPAVDIISLSGFEQGKGSYQIGTLDGKIIKSSASIDFQVNQEIPVHDLSIGVYLLSISIPNHEPKIFRIIKQ